MTGIDSVFELFLLGAVLVIVGQMVLERVAPVYALIGSLIPVALGVLAGTVEETVASSQLEDALAPFSALGLVLLGFFTGFRVGERRPEANDHNVVGLVLVTGLLSFAVVAMTAYVALDWSGLYGIAGSSGVALAGGLGACAAAAGAHPLARMFEARGRRGPGSRSVAAAAWLLEALAIALLGVLVSFDQPVGEGAGLSSTEWVVLSLLAGVVLGVLMSALTAALDDLLGVTAALGVVLVGAGASLFAGLSPLFIGLVVGLTARLTGLGAAATWRGMEALERPAQLLVLFLAAAAWTAESGLAAWLALGFVALQLGVRMLGSWWGFRRQRTPLTWHRWPGPLLLAQGALPVAVALSCGLHFGAESAAANLLVTCAIGAVLVNELVAAATSAFLGQLYGRRREGAGPSGGGDADAGESDDRTGPEDAEVIA